MDNSCARSKNILMRTANPKAQYLRYNKQIKKSILRVLDSGSYILGKEVGFFEKEFGNKENFRRVRHMVFSREGLPCFICGILIQKTVVSSRRIFLCPVCQNS